MVKFDLGSEPERARADRKHQSSGVFVASGERMLQTELRYPLQLHQSRGDSVKFRPLGRFFYG